MCCPALMSTITPGFRTFASPCWASAWTIQAHMSVSVHAGGLELAFATLCRKVWHCASSSSTGSHLQILRSMNAARVTLVEPKQEASQAASAIETAAISGRGSGNTSSTKRPGWMMDSKMATRKNRLRDCGMPCSDVFSTR